MTGGQDCKREENNFNIQNNWPARLFVQVRLTAVLASDDFCRKVDCDSPFVKEMQDDINYWECKDGCVKIDAPQIPFRKSRQR